MPEKRAICYIPSGEMLRLRDVGHWLNRFREFTRRTATEIVLPAVGWSGPLYDSGIHPHQTTLKATNLLPDWIKQAREILGKDGVIWSSIVAECGFLSNEALWLEDEGVC